MWFKDDDHSEKFNVLREKVDMNGDKEYDAALYALSALDYKDVTGYVAPGEIDFRRLLKAAKAWSDAEEALVKLAANLFNGRTKADVKDVFWHLDQYNARAALQAISIRYM